MYNIYVPNNYLNHDTNNIKLLRPHLGCIIIFYSMNHIISLYIYYINMKQICQVQLYALFLNLIYLCCKSVTTRTLE